MNDKDDKENSLFAYKKNPEISFIKGVQMYSEQEKQSVGFFFFRKKC